MSKRKNRNPNKANQSPSGKPSRREAGSRTANLTRNRLMKLGLGGLALMAILGIRELISGKNDIHGKGPNPDIGTSQLRPSIIIPQDQPTEKTPEYSEWASKIELPIVNVDLNAKPISEKQIGEYFQLPKTGRLQPELLYEAIDSLRSGTVNDLKKIQAPEERSIRIANFVSALIKGYCLFTGEQVPITIPSNSFQVDEWLHKVNQLFIPHGQWFTRVTGKMNTMDLTIFKIERMVPIEISNGSFKREIPLIVFEERETLEVDPQAKFIGGIGGEYVERGNYIVWDPKGLGGDADRMLADLKETLPENTIKNLAHDLGIAGLKHEAMHFVMVKKYGMGIDGKKTAIGKGEINMGGYSLKEPSHTWPGAFQIHELAGIGFGLANSNDAGQLVLLSATTSGIEQYHFASMIAFYEMRNSKYATPSMKKQIEDALGGKPQKKSEIAHLIRQFPSQELNRIGEAMTKLAIHLTQPK